MFKKNITPTGTHILSGKDLKTLRRDILKQFPAITEEELAEVLPSKATVTLTKLNNRCQVYGLENGNPLFFDEGHGSLLPTVYTLWVLPHILPTLPTWSEVSPKILGGADLFLQGVLVPEGGLGDWLANSARTVLVPGNPRPFAVGRMAVSRIEAARDGMKGRGLSLLHHYPDLLWAMGDKSAPEGFTPQRVSPLAQPAAGEAVAAPADGGAEGVAAAEQQLQGLSLSTSGETHAATAADAASAAAGGFASNGEAEAAAAATAAGGSQESDAPLSMDALLEAAVVAGLRRVTNAELPMQTGDFYTKHMLACKPEGVVFDFKHSSYKKLGKLLDKFEKDKVLTQKVIRKQDNISAINRSHPLLVAAAGAEGSAAASSRPASAGASGSKGTGAGGAPGAAAVRISYCYRAPSSLRALFGEAGRDKERLYSGAEVEEALRQYVAATGLLVEGGGGSSEALKLDPLLVGALYNKKEPQKAGHAAPLPEVLARLIDKLQLYHRLARPGEQGEVEVVRKGQVRPVSIADEKRSGRDVTKVAHLESFALAPEEMAAVFQKKFQCSATVSELPGKQESDKEIMLQGRLAKQVAEFLGATYGIPPAFLEVKAGKK